MNATGTFSACAGALDLYHNDRPSHAKIWGCVVGFAGVMLGQPGARHADLDFTLLGEGFVVIAAFVLAAASIYGKQVSQRMDSMVMTGWQLALGGAALLAIGWGLGLAHRLHLAVHPAAGVPGAAVFGRVFAVEPATQAQTGQPGHGVQLLGASVLVRCCRHLPGRGPAGVEEPARPFVHWVCVGIWLVTRDAPAPKESAPLPRQPNKLWGMVHFHAKRFNKS